MPVTVVTLDDVQALIDPLQNRIEELERKMKGTVTPKCRMNEAERILSRSNVQITRLIHAGIIKKAVQSGRPWFFDRAELLELAANPKRMDLTNPDNYVA